MGICAAGWNFLCLYLLNLLVKVSLSLERWYVWKKWREKSSLFICVRGRAEYYSCVALPSEPLPVSLNMEQVQIEEYFKNNHNDWSLLSYLEWKKEKGIELRGKAVEHNNYVKQLSIVSTREAKHALELFKVFVET